MCFQIHSTTSNNHLPINRNHESSNSNSHCQHHQQQKSSSHCAPSEKRINRRHLLISSIATLTGFTINHDDDNYPTTSSSSTTFINIQIPTASAAATTTTTTQEEISTITQASKTLHILLSNWEKATTDCNYADVPRDLLETKNKELLLEKASTFALFDKSVSVVSCKKSNKIVRDYLGLTGKGPMVGIEKKLLKRNVVDCIEDVDLLDDYFGQVETFSQSLSRASSFSYAAGIADFDSVNNFAKVEIVGTDANGNPSTSTTTSLSSSDSSNKEGKDKQQGEDSNLEQARKAIMEASQCLDNIVSILENNNQSSL